MWLAGKWRWRCCSQCKKIKVTELHRQCNAQSVYIFTFKYAVLVYKCLHGSARAYLTDELCQVADVEARQRLRSSSSSSLIVSHTLLATVDDRTFPIADARVWNSLPDLVTSAPSVAVFRSRLQTHLFSISCRSPLWLDCTVPAQWRLVALDTIIVLPYLLTAITAKYVTHETH